MFFPELLLYNFVIYRVVLTFSEGPGLISAPDIRRSAVSIANVKYSKVGEPLSGKTLQEEKCCPQYGNS
jgi:hypothetical protein